MKYNIDMNVKHIENKESRKDTDFDFVWTQNILDLLDLSNGTFDAISLFTKISEKIIDLTNCERIDYIKYKTNLAEEKTYVYPINSNDLAETIVFEGVLFIKGEENGKLRIIYSKNKPIENIEKIFKILLHSLEIIIARVYEKTELQNAHTKTITSALASDYGNITYIDLVHGTEMIVKANNSGVLVQDDENNVCFKDRIAHYVENFVVPEQKEIMAKDLALETALENVKDGKTYAVSLRILINGKVHYRTVSYVPQIENGELVSLVVGFHSTDSEHEYQEQLEEALKQAKVANNAKTTFLFNMSHDIRTPMNAIIGFTRLAKTNIDDKEKVDDYLSKISTAGEQLLGLINKVLEMSRIESGNIVLNKRSFNLLDKIQANIVVFNELCYQKDLHLDLKLHNFECPYIISDPDRIDQIINNLLGNATKYTAEGGNITLTLAQKKNVHTNKVTNTFIVEDTGIGMSKEFVEHIFDEFARETSSTISRIEGTGLGMSIVKRIVDLLGGTIEVESEKDKGTKITFVIETDYVDSIDEKEKTNIDSKLSLKGTKILLVEDNLLNQEIAKELLTESGMIVYTASDGDEAVEAVRNANKGDYDIILMDIQMPRMNGYEATKEIRKLPLGKYIPIIALSANAFEEDKMRSLKEGMNGHIAKPIDVNKLFEELLKHLGKC